MGFLKKFSSLFASPSSSLDESGATWLYVRCNRCGEKLRTRVNTRTELSPEFGNSDLATSFHCRKVLIGEKRCYQQIELNLNFDNKYRLIDKQISGGTFITQEEYEQL
jgi:hypothetical protein